MEDENFRNTPIQFLIYKIKASFVPNSMSLPRSAQFLHVSAVLPKFAYVKFEKKLAFT